MRTMRLAVILGLALVACPTALAQVDCESAVAEADEAGESSPRLEQCAAEGDPYAQAVLGFMYWSASGSLQCKDDNCVVSPARSNLPEGLTVAELRRRGLSLIESAAVKGRADAQNELGVAALEGWLGVRQDFAVAREWLEKSTAAGDAIAPFNLARMHFAGWGVPVSEEAAERYFRMSALRGYKPAYCSLMRYLDDKGRIEATILRWTSLSAIGCAPDEIAPELLAS